MSIEDLEIFDILRFQQLSSSAQYWLVELATYGY